MMIDDGMLKGSRPNNKNEKKMKHILKQNQLFVQSFLTLEEARAKFGSDKYKLELIDDLARDGETQFGVYTNTLQN